MTTDCTYFSYAHDYTEEENCTAEYEEYIDSKPCATVVHGVARLRNRSDIWSPLRLSTESVQAFKQERKHEQITILVLAIYLKDSHYVALWVIWPPASYTLHQSPALAKSPLVPVHLLLV
jgi:hypothetical protein